MHNYARYMRADDMPWQYRLASGIVSILFGLLAVFWPVQTVGVLIWLFGVYTIVYGAVQIANTVRAMRAHKTWWTHLVIGIASIVAGILVLTYPEVTAGFLLFTIAWWAIVVGVIEITTSFVTERWLTAIGGLVLIILGLVLLADPRRGLLTVMLVVGVFAVARGVWDLVLLVRKPTQTRATV